MILLAISLITLDLRNEFIRNIHLEVRTTSSPAYPEYSSFPLKIGSLTVLSKLLELENALALRILIVITIILIIIGVILSPIIVRYMMASIAKHQQEKILPVKGQFKALLTQKFGSFVLLQLIGPAGIFLYIIMMALMPQPNFLIVCSAALILLAALVILGFVTQISSLSLAIEGNTLGKSLRFSIGLLKKKILMYLGFTLQMSLLALAIAVPAFIVNMNLTGTLVFNLSGTGSFIQFISDQNSIRAALHIIFALTSSSFYTVFSFIMMIYKYPDFIHEEEITDADREIQNQDDHQPEADQPYQPSSESDEAVIK